MVQKQGLGDGEQWRKMVKKWKSQKMTHKRDPVGRSQAHSLLFSPQMCLVLFGLTLGAEQRKIGLTLGRVEIVQKNERLRQLGRMKFAEVWHLEEWRFGRLGMMSFGEAGRMGRQVLKRL